MWTGRSGGEGREIIGGECSGFKPLTNKTQKNVCKLLSDVDVLNFLFFFLSFFLFFFLWIALYLEWGEKEGEKVISEGGKICVVVGI